MHQIFDTHAHYDDEAYNLDRDEILKSLADNNIGTVLNCSSDMESSHKSVELCDKYSFIYGAVGIHPHSAKDYTKNDSDILKTLVSHPKIKAIGEIGLDYHYDFSPREQQIICLEAQLKIAAEVNLPIIFHDREAHADTLEILKKYKPRGVVHCFSGSVEMAGEIIRLGMYIGLGGAVTFKNARTPKEVAAFLPLDKLLLETDCPYMTPAPHRGKRNDSTFLPLVVAQIAEIKQISEQEIIDQTTQNANYLFNI